MDFPALPRWINRQGIIYLVVVNNCSSPYKIEEGETNKYDTLINNHV